MRAHSRTHGLHQLGAAILPLPKHLSMPMRASMAMTLNLHQLGAHRRCTGFMHRCMRHG